jgi:hypothetical protein
VRPKAQPYLRPIHRAACDLSPLPGELRKRSLEFAAVGGRSVSAVSGGDVACPLASDVDPVRDQAGVGARLDA